MNYVDDGVKTEPFGVHRGFRSLVAGCLALLAVWALSLPFGERAYAAVPDTLTLETGETGTLQLPAKFSPTAKRILNKAKERADYLRINDFNYGDAKLNPAFDDSERLVACDRFVQWVFYDLGFQDLPQTSGLVVYSGDPTHDLTTWCEAHGFQRIGKKDLQAGDIVFLGVNVPGHVYILGYPQENGLWQRYDCGEIVPGQPRCRMVQPFVEPVEYPANPFRYAYRIAVPPVSWSTSDGSVAAVDADGQVTAVGEGTCKVIAQSDIARKTYTITVQSSTIEVDSMEEVPSDYTGKAVIGGETYHIKDGKKFTGELVEDGKSYFYKNGVLHTGFYKSDGITRYYTSGIMLTGFRKIDGKFYYFYEDGAMKTASWGNIEGGRYYFKKNGAAVTGWKKINGKYYFFDEKTCNLKRSCWVGKWYVNKKGVRTKHR